MPSTIDPARRATVLGAVLVGAAGAAIGRTAADNGDKADNGVRRVKSVYPFDESIRRLKADIAGKGIMFFTEIDQAKLAAASGIQLRRSTLLVFGNPPLGTQFITANPDAGLDWPVRLLVTQEDNGDVYAVYSDFAWIARRHAITNREPQFAMATKVIGSITSAIAAKA